jgi:CRP-like cAMP-binding protein
MGKLSSLWGNLFHLSDQSQHTIFETLRNVPIFRELKKGEIKEIERIIHHRYFKPQEVIFWEGETGVGMYIIQRGEIGIYQDRETDHEEELVRLGEGDFFGEMALLNEGPRSATAISLTNAHIIGLYRPDLFNLFELKPRFGVKVLMKLADMLAIRLRKTNEELQELKLKFSKKEVLL